MEIHSEIVLISSLDPENHSFGTGFIFHKDQQDTYVLTCAHVVRDVGGDGNVAVASTPSKIVTYGSQANNPKETGLDLAVLKVKGLFGKGGFTLRLAGKRGDNVVISGFRHYGTGQHVLKPLKGVLGEPVGLEYIGSPVRFQAWELIVSDDDTLQKGYSGSPVVDLASGCVLGVASHQEGSGKKGLIISVEGLLKIWQDMPPNLLEPAECTILSSEIQLPEPRMNLDMELATFEKVINGIDEDTRCILIHGESGMGKSYLLQLYKLMAAGKGIDTLEFGLGAQITVDQCIDQIVASYGFERFPRYDEFRSVGRPELLTRSKEAEWQESLTRKFFIDMSNCRGMPNLIIFFDQLEKVDQSFKHWLGYTFLSSLSSRIPMTVAVAGQELISQLPSRQIYKSFHLAGVKLKDYLTYAAQKKASLRLDSRKFSVTY